MPYTDQALPHAGSAEVMFNGLFDEPAGTLACTIRRSQLTNLTQALASGTPVARILPLPAGMVVSQVGVYPGGTAEATGTHYWNAVTDVNGNVLAVTADQTGAAYVSGTAMLKTALTSPLVIPQTGAYYVVVSCTAGTPPTLAGAPGSGASATLAGLPPVFMGTFGAQQAPPAVGANLGALTAAGSNANIGFWLF